MADTRAAGIVIRELFTAYLAQPDELPSAHHVRAVEAAVADYIAGMTDRFALRETA